MFFTDLYKSPKVTFAKFRHVHTPPPDYGDPDLVSKDKIKQKAAVKKYLDEKIRGDWEFEWPTRASASSPPVKPDAAASLASPDATAVVVPAEKDHQALTTKAVVHDGPDNTPQSHPSDVTGLASPPPAAPDGLTTHEIEAAAHNQDVFDAAPPSESTRQEAPGGAHDRSIDDGNESDDDTASTYSVFSEDEYHFRPRLEWESEISDEDSSSEDDGSASVCHFRFESPDTVGETIRAEVLSKKEKRRRATRDEVAWNEGLACFEARRNAWTGAKTVRLKKKPISPTSGLASLSPRRLFFRSSPPTSPLSSSPNDRRSGDVPRTPSDSSDVQKDMAPPLSKKQTKSSSHSIPAAQLPIETIIPIAPPLLPPANAMRASISPSVFPALYDKLVVNGLTPSCPVNLADMIRACVVGWKRDGEWPPRATVDPPPVRRKKRKSSEIKRKSGENGTGQRRMSLGLLGKDDGGGIRRSMQKFFGHGNAA